MKAVFTGGHHNPAIPVIQELLKRDSATQIIWIGHKHTLIGDKNETLEYKEITALKIPFYELIAGKVYKTVDPIRLLKIPVGFIQAFFLLLKLRPDIIVSFGGYLAAPVVLAGFFLGIPSVTHEQTVIAGYANKFISFFARKIFISWPQSAKYFPKEKVVLSGLPIRESINKVQSNTFDLTHGLKTLYITGGKTGSHKINLFVLQNMEKLLSKYNVIHQCGDYSVFDDYDVLSKKYNLIKNSVSGAFYLQKFIFEKEIGEVYAKSDVVISRSGANTTAELLQLNKPCILIPIPWVSHNEQYENAKILVEAGLGLILPESDLPTADVLSLIADRLFAQPLNSVKSVLNSGIPHIIMADEIQKLTHR